MLEFFVSAQTAIAERLRRDDQGATAVEYGLIVALIAAVIATVVGVLGKDIGNAFQNMVGHLGG